MYVTRTSCYILTTSVVRSPVLGDRFGCAEGVAVQDRFFLRLVMISKMNLVIYYSVDVVGYSLSYKKYPYGLVGQS